MTDLLELATPRGWPSKGIQPHAFANIEPLPDADGRRDMVVSVKARGIQEKIKIFEDAILDGRTRYLAGLEAGIFSKPVENWRDYPQYFIEFNGPDWQAEWGTDALDYVWDRNEVRRHSSASQRAMAASLYGKLKQPAVAPSADLLGDAAPAANLQDTVKARAERADVSERMVATTDVIARRGAPELQQAVLDGTIAAHEAEKLVDLPAEEQKAIVEAGDKKKVRAAAKEAAPKKPKAALPDAPKNDLLSGAAAQVASEVPAKSPHRMMPVHAKPYVSFAHHVLALIKGDGSAPPEHVTLEAFGLVKWARAFGILDGDEPSAAFAQHLDDVGGPLPLPMERQPVPDLGKGDQGALSLDLDLGEAGTIQMRIRRVVTGEFAVCTALEMPIATALTPWKAHATEELAVWHGLNLLRRGIGGVSGSERVGKYRAPLERAMHWLGEVATAWGFCARPDELTDMLDRGAPEGVKAKPAKAKKSEAASKPRVASAGTGEATGAAMPSKGASPVVDINAAIRAEYAKPAAERMGNEELAASLGLPGANAVKQRAKRMGIGDPDNQKAAVAAANKRRAEASA